MNLTKLSQHAPANLNNWDIPPWVHPLKHFAFAVRVGEALQFFDEARND